MSMLEYSPETGSYVVMRSACLKLSILCQPECGITCFHKADSILKTLCCVAANLMLIFGVGAEV